VLRRRGWRQKVQRVPGHRAGAPTYPQGVSCGPPARLVPMAADSAANLYRGGSVRNGLAGLEVGIRGQGEKQTGHQIYRGSPSHKHLHIAGNPIWTFYLTNVLLSTPFRM